MSTTLFNDDILGVVLDAGSQNMKAGFAGEPSPRAMVPTTVARFRRDGLTDGIPQIYCGTEAIKKRGISKMVWPVREGMIQNWDEMEKMWHYIFYKELHVPPENSRIMHSVHPLTPKSDKQRMAEILFESFAINGLYLAKSPTLVLNAYGRTSGVVYENGYACSYAAPVFEGFPMKYATVTSPVTGKMLSDRLQNLMFKAGYSFTTPYEIDLIDQIKKDICYISQDYATELTASSGYESKAKYNLPDGQHIMLGQERFLCPEVLFKPELEDLKCRNIIDSICRSIDMCDLEYRPLFYNNIVFSGGTSLTTGLVERVTRELTQILKKNLPDVTLKVDAMEMRKYAAWAGGSMLASFPNLREFWFTKEEYEDVGSERIKFKFF
uniref:Actin n=1 Tax=Heliothis virescens TaxID=7102 RepID=A0A2A4JZW6_HELVI